MSTANALRDLRELLDARFPDAIPVPRRQGEVVATGVAELDGLLPNGGFPRGRRAVWAPRGGATAVLRAACRATVIGGERAVWVDGDGTVAGAFWDEGTILIRPRTRLHALRAAETLLRSGGFALVVLAGADAEGTENVRLSRAAHEGGVACVAAAARSRACGTSAGSRAIRHFRTGAGRGRARVRARAAERRRARMPFLCLHNPAWPSGPPAPLHAPLLTV